MTDLSTDAVRSGLLRRIFLDHPATVQESYFGHMRFALWFCFWLIAAAGAALIHAFVPALCESTASSIIKRLHARIVARH